MRQDGGDLLTKANDIIKALGSDVLTRKQITGATRLRSYIHDRPPLIKISFRNVKEKILVLRNKSLLKEKAPYKEVYINSSKSHAERLIELNARTLLRQLPQGSNFRVDANGRIRPREKTDRQDQQQRQPETETRREPQDQH